MMLDKGFIANTSIYPTLAHNQENTSLYGKAVDEVFAKIAELLQDNKIEQFLDTPEAHTGFARLS
jgi:glutamate-1-semialdehyde 2,1-aminomutase